jgi:hypothetical protein
MQPERQMTSAAFGRARLRPSLSSATSNRSLNGPSAVQELRRILICPMFRSTETKFSDFGKRLIINSAPAVKGVGD